MFLYGLNRKNYHHLLDKLQKENILPTFYAYHANMGFIGAPVIAYLFFGLQRKKKLPFLNRDNIMYNFPDKNKDLIYTVAPFYYTFLTGIGFAFIICFIGLMIKLKIFFPS
ncbi:hypothetical protein SY86_09475 [Erwinia tracheiphila]|uniref:Uncharacterized protein n=1 Tax=Erwinia tracheiphila TaxID=65700 RepID=A0A0M2KFS7_9GAMM|nr:hypothetical protein SY86_09475 [Erwinia tracheiphila]